MVTSTGSRMIRGFLTVDGMGGNPFNPAKSTTSTFGHQCSCAKSKLRNTHRAFPARLTNNPAMAFLQFPDGFQWGVATASYQIEGAIQEDDRGSPSGTLCSATRGRNPGRRHRRHRLRPLRTATPKNFAHIADSESRPTAYSIVLDAHHPFGRGAVNEKGLSFY